MKDNLLRPYDPGVVKSTAAEAQKKLTINISRFLTTSIRSIPLPNIAGCRTIKVFAELYP